MPDTARFMSCGTSSIAWGAIASRPKAAPTEIVAHGSETHRKEVPLNRVEQLFRTAGV